MMLSAYSFAQNDRRGDRGALAVRVHDHVSLPLPHPDDRAGRADCGPQDDRASYGQRELRRCRTVLGAHLRHHLCRRRGHRHSNGVPVRHELGPLRALCRAGGRPDPLHGKRVRVLRGVVPARRVPLRRVPRGAAGPLARGGRRGLRRRPFRLLHRRHERVDATPGRIPDRRRPRRTDEPRGAPDEPVRALAVPARDLGRDRHGIDGDGRHRGVLPARGTRPGTGTAVRARRRRLRRHLRRLLALPDGRVPRRAHHAPSAVEDGRDGRAVQDAGRRAAGDHRHARSRAAGADGSDLRARHPQLSRLRELLGARDGPERHPRRSRAAGGNRLLRVPHHGRARNDLHRDHGGVRVHALAGPAVRPPQPALDPDARDAVSLHRQRSRMGRRRSRAAAVGGLRAAARGGRLVHQRHDGDDVLHAAGLHGPVPRARHPLSAPLRTHRPSGTRTPRGRRAINRGIRDAAVSLNTTWFIVLAFTLAVYAVLDGFDIGVGAIHLLLGRTREDRAALIDSIGPVWNGNEVWLLAAGGSMVVAFPTLYASSFSGFYLPLMLVLWLLLLRGLGIEFRHQIHHPMWEDFWDVVFSAASVLLALLFGVAFANVLRGVPFDESGGFRGTFAVLLNPFSILGGVLSVATLALHGACWAALKSDGDLQRRARRFAAVLWIPAAVLLAAIVAASFAVRPDFLHNFTARPLLLVFPLAALASLAMNRAAITLGRDRRAFVASCAYVASVLASVTAGLYPTLLPAAPGSAGPGLDIYNAAAPPGRLKVALAISLVGLAIVSVYLVSVYRIWSGKTSSVYH